MFSNMKIKTKLLISFIILIVLGAVIAFLGYNGASKITNSYERMATLNVPKIINLEEAKGNYYQVMVGLRGLLVPQFQTPALLKTQYDYIDTAWVEAGRNMAEYEAAQKNEEEQKLWDEFMSYHKKMDQAITEAVELARERDKLIQAGLDATDMQVMFIEEEISASTTNLSELSAKTFEVLGQIIENAKTISNTEYAQSAATAKRLLLTLLIVFGIVGLIGAGFYLYIPRGIQTTINNINHQIRDVVEAVLDGRLSTRADAMKTNIEFRDITIGYNNTLDAVVTPLAVASDYITRIASGDMPPVITEKYNGDFSVIVSNINDLIETLNEIANKAQLISKGDLTVDLKKRSDNDILMQSLSEMVKATAAIISEFNTAANNISASSQQMSSTSQQLSQGASEQASSAEEVSSSMEEMAANIQQNNENAQQTEKIALNAAEGVNRVSDAAQETLRSMRDIADKVSIIGEIARQTNILALNAAVEAARAGEHGKGFAVVAAEVRKLAERSQISAVEIDALTKNSVRITEDAGKMMAAIAPEISKTSKLVQEIAAASLEQNSGAEQVNNAIQQLNHVTQQNAAASEQMATSSEELASQAQQLIEMISYFKFSEEDTGRMSSISEMSRPVMQPRKAQREPGAYRKEPPVKVQKGVNLNMGKDNLDSEYERF